TVSLMMMAGFLLLLGGNARIVTGQVAGTGIQHSKRTVKLEASRRWGSIRDVGIAEWIRAPDWIGRARRENRKPAVLALPGFDHGLSGMPRNMTITEGQVSPAFVPGGEAAGRG